MTNLREVMETDRRQCQLHAALALAELMAVAAMDGLPILAWRMTPLGLVGEVPCSYGQRDEEAEFQQWVCYMAASAATAWQNEDGVERVKSLGSYRIRRGNDVPVTILATLDQSACGVFRESA